MSLDICPSIKFKSFKSNDVLETWYDLLRSQGEIIYEI